MISIILIEPETSGNVGAIARTMANFEVNNLILINPKCKIDSSARCRAKNANHILDKTKIRTTRVLKNFDYLIGSTAKLGNDYNIPRSPLTPEDLSKKLKEIKDKKIGIILGRESLGLSNEEIQMCDFIVSIPSSPKYRAMNISHALNIILYEIFKEKHTEELMKPYTPMSAREKERIMELLNVALKKMSFETEEKRETQRRMWKRMITKSFMTKREAYALMGFLKKIK